MRADELLRQLEAMRDAGLDLSQADVVVTYTEYDASIPYDMGRPAQTYPEDVCIRNGEVVLGNGDNDTWS